MRRDKRVTTFFNRLFHRLRNEYSKPLIITITAALSIGVLFGFIMLQMIQDEEEESTYYVHAKTEVEKEQQEQTSIDLPEVQLFVHQGGVFSDEANTKTFVQKLAEEQIPFIIKEADGQFFVWMNIYETEETANKQTDKMDKQGVDTFVKEWHIPASTVYVDEETATWLKAFLPVVEQASESSTMKQEALADLLTIEGVSKQVQSWQNHIEQDVVDHDSEEQQMLEVIALYEKVLKDIKE